MKYVMSLSPCGNPECPISFPSRSNKFHCCDKCRARAHYLENQEEIRNQNADVAFIKSVEKKLKKLSAKYPEDTVYSNFLFDAMEIPIDAAVKIAKDTSIGSRVHFFSNYGIESSDGKNFRIVKRNRNGR